MKIVILTVMNFLLATSVFAAGNIKINANLEFPDGTIQSTATVQGPVGLQGAKGDTGPQGPKGDTGQVSLATICSAITSGGMPLPVFCSNTAPTANAGVSQDVAIGSVKTLDGSGSSDANNDPLTFVWSITSKPTGSNASLSSTTIAKPTFKADVGGSYIFQLVVRDGYATNTASVTVTAHYPRIGDTLTFSDGTTMTVEKLFYMRNSSGTIYNTYYSPPQPVIVAKITVTNRGLSSLTVGPGNYFIIDGTQQIDNIDKYSYPSGSNDELGQAITDNASKSLLTGITFTTYVTFENTTQISDGQCYFVHSPRYYGVGIDFSYKLEFTKSDIK
ncbi:MAG: PKD domain-containing protein [Desulfuromonadaceae bacterium]